MDLILAGVFLLGILWFMYTILGGWEGIKIFFVGYIGAFALYVIPAILIAQIWALGAGLWIVGVTIWIAFRGSGPNDGGGMDGSNY